MSVADLPVGAAPPALEFRHFPSRFHAFVWRNWELVTADRMAVVAGTRAEEIERTGRAMGLSGSPGVAKELEPRAAITTIRRNWHLLPYEQLLQLLAWTPEQLAFALREDDFLFIKLGSLKPSCPPLQYETPSEETLRREQQMAEEIRHTFPEGLGTPSEPLFAFVRDLSRDTSTPAVARNAPTTGTMPVPRICYSYFALYGDPLLEPDADPYPDALLARLAEVGINGVWLPGLLNRMAPFPWDPSVSTNWEQRLEQLRRLTARARKHGIGIYLYLNEPRAMPVAFHELHPGLRGVTEGDYAALCTGSPEVQRWITASVESICRQAPDLAGIFTISGSENLTSCWSHWRGGECPRCGPAGAPRVIADLHRRIQEGIDRSRTKARLIAWDWGWAGGWTEEIAAELPKEITLMSTSEWELPINRGGVATTVGEYSMSAPGPGPRARRHWNAARKNGLPVMAKIQAGNTWELSSVPWIPVADTVARHCAALRDLGVQGLLLGWTLGGYPSANLEVAALVSRTSLSPDDAMTSVARRRFGPLGPAVVTAWKDFSRAFGEFPFHIGVVYNGPLQMGPANLLWSKPTGYSATMVGLPYDDLHAWRAVYPEEVYVNQLLKAAEGFETASLRLGRSVEDSPTSGSVHERTAVGEELRMAQAAAIHFRSAANQARFVALRTRLHDAASSASIAKDDAAALKQIATGELELARRLKGLQEHDSRLGFEASNQYFYTPLDLAEKVLNCRQLLRELSFKSGTP